MHQALLGAGQASGALAAGDAEPTLPPPGEAVVAFCVLPLDGRDLPVLVACADDEAQPVRLVRLTGFDHLWPVSDRSTRLLMLKFYESLHAGASAPAALRSAQTWLRDAVGGEIQALVQQLNPRVRTAGKLSAAPGPMRIKWVSGDPPDGSPGERPFAHPFHWAGFVCIA